MFRLKSSHIPSNLDGRAEKFEINYFQNVKVLGKLNRKRYKGFTLYFSYRKMEEIK